MYTFLYTIKNKDGDIVKGKIEAESEDKAIEYLHNRGEVIVSLRKISGKIKEERVSKRGSIKTDELVVFSRQLTTLIESGIPIVGAMDTLYQQTQNQYFKKVINAITKDLQEGASLASSISKYPNIFSELYVSMVEAAESSGNLPEILERLSVYLEKTSALRKKIISSLTYPIVVISMAIGITAFLIFKVIPTFKSIFESLGGKLPLPTQLLINFSDMLRNSIVYLIFIFFILFALFRKYISTDRGKKNYHRFLLSLPILGDIIKKISIAQFARTFSTLVKSGVPILASLDIVGKTSGNKIIEEAVLGAKKSIQEGIPISKPLEESGIFPPMVVKMIAVGEKTGKMEAMLSKIAQFYEEQTEAVIASLTSLIEPIVIGFLGIVVGGIVIALFLPIIKITTLLQR
ncbi:MAG: type II secretion system F family protein [Candidatus Omnitrophica bacterium]|nr:type II secretion system F family protein [Candidatus Omnitrophota bacterium]